MAEFLAAVKLFIKLYPMLKDLGSRAGKLYTDIKIDRENGKIELILKQFEEGEEISDEELQKNASDFNDLFR